MDVQIAIRAAQHRVEPNRHLGVIGRSRTTSSPPARNPASNDAESFARDDDGRHDAGVRIALEARSASSTSSPRDRLSNTTTRGRLRSATAHERFGVANPDDRNPQSREPPLRPHPAERRHRANTISRLFWPLIERKSAVSAPKYGGLVVKSTYDSYSTLRAFASL